MTILRLDSSITGEHSVSRTLTDAITAQLTAVSPGEMLVVRDLVAAPLPTSPCPNSPTPA